MTEDSEEFVVQLSIGYYLLAVFVGIMFHLVFVMSTVFEVLSFECDLTGWFCVLWESAFHTDSKPEELDYI